LEIRVGREVKEEGLAAAGEDGVDDTDVGGGAIGQI
jgi:hypothetical protein